MLPAAVPKQKTVKIFQSISDTILSELNEVEDGEKYDQFIRILSTDPEVMGEFFASPVTIQTERVYPVENYGSSETAQSHTGTFQTFIHAV